MGTANSFLKAAYVTLTRRGHQITAATLNILQHKAYGKYTEDAQSDGQESLEFGVGKGLNVVLSVLGNHPQLRAKYLCLLDHYENPTSRYTWMLWLNCQWFFALDHTPYSRSNIDLDRGKGIRRRVTASGPLPSNWQNFFCNSDNKEELFSFLSEQVMQLVVKESKQLVVRQETGTPFGLANEWSEILDEIRLTFGTGKNRRYIAAHQIAKALGLQKSRALPVLNAITGCDTVSAFTGHSKKAAWATWNAFPEVTTAFLSLASTPSELPDGILSSLERSIVLLYDRASTCCDVNMLRKKLFSRKSRSLEHLPPTRAALEQHIKRTAYQAGHIWGQATIALVSLPSLCDWGWMKSGDELEPLWTTL
ncbi:hypothetical protein Hamer_G008452 [Homarus americanus]|uniref:Uncharacterized protein n=1 Tax=Homarus americanus TaxID=6706 RepID=A0A8J5N463_HOMAM|nr:hypothetical protein Hamer_G008452 [Homarus americanus]